MMTMNATLSLLAIILIMHSHEKVESHCSSVRVLVVSMAVCETAKCNVLKVMNFAKQILHCNSIRYKIEVFAKLLQFCENSNYLT